MAVHTVKNQPAVPPAEETPFAVMAGWLMVAFAIIPLLLGVQSGSLEYLLIGAGLGAAGVVAIAAGRAARRWHHQPRP